MIDIHPMVGCRNCGCGGFDHDDDGTCLQEIDDGSPAQCDCPGYEADE